MKQSINFSDIFLMAIDALRKNRMRSLLATLGIIIGISTLILVLGIARAAQGLISDQLASFGADTIFVQVKVPNADGGSSGAALVSGVQIKTLKIADVLGVRKIPNIRDSYGAVIGQEKIVSLQNEKKGIVYGTTPSYVTIDKSKVEQGRYFTDSENESLAKVAVLGSNVKKELFGERDAIDKNIRIRGVNFRVIGVMEKRGAVLFQNYDDYVYLPLKTEQKLLLGYDYLPFFVAQVDDPGRMAETTDDVTRFLRVQHRLQSSDPLKDDFEVTNSEESQKNIGIVFGAISLLFSGIAALSLIVGGVGIMNIMYVSVTERIREIGLRKAIGAKKRAILLQFLLESLTITLLGGLIGIAMGLLLSAAISAGAKLAGFNLQLLPSLPDFAIGVLVTALFGIIFGLGPAKKAADLKPIEALRAE